jgi:hypothetical protein
MSSSPRSILKKEPSPSPRQAPPALPFENCPTVFSPRVHFPPTPCIVSSVHSADSPQTYDRKPIVVSPNACVLPGRGETRFYSPPINFVDEEAGRGRGRGRGKRHDDVKGSYFHPRAFEACEPEPLDEINDSPPMLVSSDLPTPDELEDAVMTPPDLKLPAPVKIKFPWSLPGANLHSDSEDEDDSPGVSKGRLSPRPSLKRTRFSIPQAKEFCPSLLDEGCLGGF